MSPAVLLWIHLVRIQFQSVAANSRKIGNCQQIVCDVGFEPSPCNNNSIGNSCRECRPGYFNDIQGSRILIDELSKSYWLIRKCRERRLCNGLFETVLKEGNSKEDTLCSCTNSNYRYRIDLNKCLQVEDNNNESSTHLYQILIILLLMILFVVFMVFLFLYYARAKKKLCRCKSLETSMMEEGGEASMIGESQSLLKDIELSNISNGSKIVKKTLNIDLSENNGIFRHSSGIFLYDVKSYLDQDFLTVSMKSEFQQDCQKITVTCQTSSELQKKIGICVKLQSKTDDIIPIIHFFDFKETFIMEKSKFDLQVLLFVTNELTVEENGSVKGKLTFNVCTENMQLSNIIAIRSFKLSSTAENLVFSINRQISNEEYDTQEISIDRTRLDLSLVETFQYNFNIRKYNVSGSDGSRDSLKLSINLLKSSVDNFKTIDIDLNKDLLENPSFHFWYDKISTTLKCPFAQLSIPDDATNSPVEISLHEKIYKDDEAIPDIDNIRKGNDDQIFIKHLICKADEQRFNKVCMLKIPFLSSMPERVSVYHKNDKCLLKVENVIWDASFIEIHITDFNEYIIVNNEGRNMIKFYVYGDKVDEDKAILKISPQIQKNQFHTCFVPQSFMKKFNVDVENERKIALVSHDKDASQQIEQIKTVYFEIEKKESKNYPHSVSPEIFNLEEIIEKFNPERRVTFSLQLGENNEDFETILLNWTNISDTTFNETSPLHSVHFNYITEKMIFQMAHDKYSEMTFKLFVCVIGGGNFFNCCKSFPGIPSLRLSRFSCLKEIRNYLWKKITRKNLIYSLEYSERELVTKFNMYPQVEKLLKLFTLYDNDYQVKPPESISLIID
ncbi:DgyrCDS14866 [Dimorphilus gyrociliatus]|uniref:DgyrCDS14866 n=1 Tax=Dimorphilus gyrociliatus TaxID=2664684 RepID=A0A7I8WF60_9ANNE|nr:DgyrCDS14866 [Dimorphilus gyrociliatus]